MNPNQSTKENAKPDELQSFDQLPDAAFVRVQTVAALCDTCAGSIWAWVRKGKFPAPHKVGPNCTRWRVGDLRAHMGVAA